MQVIKQVNMTDSDVNLQDKDGPAKMGKVNDTSNTDRNQLPFNKILELERDQSVALSTLRREIQDLKENPNESDRLTCKHEFLNAIYKALGSFY